jgi:CheY-like chemotaxis protein
VQVVSHGQQAVNYLAGDGQYSDRGRYPIPALVLLDLKLPVKMGTEVLRWIQAQPALAKLIVVVLTSSSDSSDIRRAYDLGARSYLVKPVALEKRLEMARAIKAYWLGMVQIPS